MGDHDRWARRRFIDHALQPVTAFAVNLPRIARGEGASPPPNCLKIGDAVLALAHHVLDARGPRTRNLEIRPERRSEMKIRVLSDLHVNVATWEPPPAEADVVVIAGDIKNGSGGFVWARKHFPDAEIVAILGNHEYYGGALDKTPSVLRQEASRAGVKLLDCDEVVLGKVRFIGCTLWTDFRLNADNPSIQDPRERDAIRTPAISTTLPCKLRSARPEP